jgi:hypothetical protein
MGVKLNTVQDKGVANLLSLFSETRALSNEHLEIPL